MSVFSEGAAKFAEELEEDALAAGKQNQGIPDDLHYDCSKTDADIQTVLEVRAAGGAQAPPAEPATEMVAVIKRHCVITDLEIDAMVLWILASYAMDDFRVFPKLALISPEKRCGKTTTMEVVGSMAKDGLIVSNMSAATIYRLAEQMQYTLLIDETDTFLKNGDAEINGLINSSHTKSAAKVTRCVGENHEPRVFSTWMPMVLASIGVLADTLMDRSITINLRRKKSHEHTERVPADLNEISEPLRQSISAWVEANRAAMRSQSVDVPNIGNDRAGDNWEPLLAVAALLGGSWPGRCERAFRELTIVEEPEQQTMLLRDIQQYFLKSGSLRVTSKELCEALTGDEDGPWKTCSNGKPLTPHLVGKLLRPYGVKPKTMRVGDNTPRGYEKAQLEDAFERYLS
ncbi:MAG TPA: hypothetical protein DCP75_18390 [Haliea salexigens]|mgnify:CR=1 FL=1|uniref:DUF3631 domain-containing protein n=1 Tax=Haliea salexigens TaxID=287487 RepID=A0A3C1KT20_9GAMM|nr:hypothetical protein [Haliea salexigens]|tara:strand:+ start:1357 stop:2562 length:1206 start_codon:yes stop_codon:yes gene_type:complete